MTEARTDIDPRFSRPGAGVTSWDETVQLLEQAELSWITTVGADGRPHTTPLVAVWDGDALYFSTGADEQKAVNLRANTHVTLLTGRAEWERGVDVSVEGDAVRVTDEALLTRLAAAWTKKWDGRWQYEVRDGAFHHGPGSALVFEVRPTKVFAFGKDPFSQTRHRF